MTTPKIKKTLKSLKPVRKVNSETMEEITVAPRKTYSFLGKLILVAVVGALAYLLAVKYRHLFLVATVNNMPITRMQLNAKLSERYGKQVLEEVINEKLLAAEIKNKNVVVTEEEVMAEINKMTQQYGSQENFNAALVQYGLTLDKAKETIKQSLGFKKLVELNGAITITDEAVTNYYNQNKTTFGTQTLDQVKESIRESLYQQELYAKSQEIFTAVREQAKVNNFLK